MAPPSTALSYHFTSTKLRSDARPTPQWRAELKRISNPRNALTIAALYAQTSAILWLAVRLHHPLMYASAFVLMGRAHAQFASLMHEAAHRLLFSNKFANDFAGRWLLGFPGFVTTDGYRFVHSAHHRQEFGPDEPDIALYAIRRGIWAANETGYPSRHGAPEFARAFFPCAVQHRLAPGAPRRLGYPVSLAAQIPRRIARHFLRHRRL